MPGVYPTSIIKSKRPDPFDLFTTIRTNYASMRLTFVARVYWLTSSVT
jgi:hypothetical protein